MKKTVALISGGEGYEREISELSANNLFSLIDKDRYKILRIHINRKGEWYIRQGLCEKYNDTGFEDTVPTFPVMLGGVSGFLVGGKVLAVDCAIPCLHGDFGEDGTVQGALSVSHISYVGQDVYASALTSDKAYTKLAAEHLNIPTARWILSDDESWDTARTRAEVNFGYPMFIKPARLGSSCGAHPVTEKEEFYEAFRDAKSYDKRIIIEEHISFEYELECALFDDGTRAVFPGGRVLTGGAFYDFRSKYTHKCSPPTETKTGQPSSIEKRISEYTEALANLIGIRHLSRFDFFVTNDGRIYFNEINAFPGMTKTSLYPRLLNGCGRGGGDFINLLIEKVCSDDRRV